MRTRATAKERKTCRERQLSEWFRIQTPETRLFLSNMYPQRDYRNRIPHARGGAMGRTAGTASGMIASALNARDTFPSIMSFR